MSGVATFTPTLRCRPGAKRARDDVARVRGISTHLQQTHEFLRVAFVAIAAAAVRFSTPSLA